MSLTNDPASDVIARYETGTCDDDALIELIGQAWQQVLEDPTERQSVAALLEVPQDALAPGSVPFAPRASASGLGVGEVLIAIASGFVLAFAKDVGGQLGKSSAQKLRLVWERFMRRKVSPPGSNNLGQPKDHDPG